MLKQPDEERKPAVSEATSVVEEVKSQEDEAPDDRHIRSHGEIQGTYRDSHQMVIDEISRPSEGVSGEKVRRRTVYSGYQPKDSDAKPIEASAKPSKSQGLQGGEMVKEIIHDIKATEAEAHRIVEEAKRAKADAISKAREEAKKMLEQAHKQGEQMIKDELAKASEEVSRRVAQIGEREAKETEVINAKAKPKVGKAIELVLSKVLS